MTTPGEDNTNGGAADDPTVGGRFNAIVAAALQELLAKAGAKGLDSDQVDALIDGIPIESMMNDAAEAMYASLIQEVPSLVESLDDGQRLVEEELSEVWGTADRLYRAFVHAAYELGAEISRSSTRHPPVVFALLGLHGRAVRVAAEVRHLAMGGFASGATARGRSLHDIAVVCYVLREAPEEIADRYLAYSHMERLADLQNYQEHAAALGRKPFTDEEVEAARTAAAEVVARWGPMMRKGNGWAAPLFPGAKSISFSQLEKLAGLGHLRPFYRLGSHYVHAGPQASNLNMRTEGGPGTPRLITVGPTVFADFGETCHGAMISLEQATAVLCGAYVHAESEDAADIMIKASAATRLVHDAGPAYGDAADRARERGWFTHRPDD